ncbi:MAG: hypothetical protein WC929_05625 [Bacilli bacterium]|jgi:regulator of replication initiation timing|nr:hypothetical protein [Bacilli bacterium]
MLDRARLIQDTTDVIEILTDTTQIDSKIEKINAEIVFLTEIINKLVKENSKTSLSNEDYTNKYEGLSIRYKAAKSKLQELIEMKAYEKGKALRMQSFLVHLINPKDKLKLWDDKVWILMVEVLWFTGY